jgi:hypothetical protein
MVSLSLSSSSLLSSVMSLRDSFVALDAAECPRKIVRGECLKPCNPPREGSGCNAHTRVPFPDHNSSSMMRPLKICLRADPWRPPHPDHNRCSWGSCHHLRCWRCRNHSRRLCSFCQYQWLRVGLVVLGRGVDQDLFRRSPRSCGRSCMHG